MVSLTRLNGFAQTIFAALGVLVGIVSIGVTLRIADTSVSPQRRLTYINLLASDVLKELRDAKSIVSYQVTADGKRLDRLIVRTSILSNDGKVSIVPLDIFEEISIVTSKPWKILAVSSQATEGQNISFSWSRVSDTMFRAKKALINPGDSIAVAVYFITSEQSGSADPPITWTARINNLDAIEEQPITRLRLQSGGAIPLSVYLGGYAIIFVLTSFFIYQFSYLYLLQFTEIKLNSSFKRVFVYSSAALLSIAAADAGNAYVFGSQFLINDTMTLSEHLLNMPVLIINWSLLTRLAYLRYRSVS